MLNSSSSIVINILLNLRNSFSISRFIDRHFDSFIKISHDNRFQWWEFGVNHGIINRPESMKSQASLIPFTSGFHISYSLVTNNMINDKEIIRFNHLIEYFFHRVGFETREENSLIINVLDESMNGISICEDRSHKDTSILIFMLFHWTHCFGSFGNSKIVGFFSISNKICNVFYSISMFDQMFIKLSIFIIERSRKC